MRKFMLLLLMLPMLACRISVAPLLQVESVSTQVYVNTNRDTRDIRSFPRPAPPNLSTVTASRSLNIRSRPGENERVIGYFYHGDVVTMTGTCQKGWAEIRNKNGLGWVNADYLSDNICRE